MYAPRAQSRVSPNGLAAGGSVQRQQRQLLGDVAPTGGASAYDGSRDAFLHWVAAVKQAGGRATVYPYHGTLNVLAWSDVFSSHDTYGTPAARYPASVAAQFDNEPDQVETGYAWYLAPPGVTRWAMSPDGMLNLQQMRDAGTDRSPEEATEAGWYKQLTAVLELAGFVGVGLIAYQVLKIVPHRGDWD